jgi:hypothetical protein
LGCTKDYDEKVWESFGNKVGWRKGGSWLSYSSLTFSENNKNHYMGHLPVMCGSDKPKTYLLIIKKLHGHLWVVTIGQDKLPGNFRYEIGGRFPVSPGKFHLSWRILSKTFFKANKNTWRHSRRVKRNSRLL